MSEKDPKFKDVMKAVYGNTKKEDEMKKELAEEPEIKEEKVELKTEKKVEIKRKIRKLLLGDN